MSIAEEDFNSLYLRVSTKRPIEEDDEVRGSPEMIIEDSPKRSESSLKR